MMAPVVSVVMPTRNRASLLPRALDSVLTQSFRELELIVVDDASTDATPAVLSACAARDERVRVLRLATAVGGAAARNRGVDVARGEFIAFLDDDDEWLPDAAAHLVTAFGAEGPSVGLVHGRFVEVEASAREVPAGNFAAPDGQARTALLRGNRFGNSAVAVRRSVLHEVGGYDARLPRLQDWDLWLRVAGVTRCAHVTQTLARVHCAHDRISTDGSALRSACALLEAKHGTALDRADRAAFLYALGRLLVEHGQKRQGRALIRRSLGEARPPARVFMGALLLLGHRPYRAAAATHGAASRGLNRLAPVGRLVVEAAGAIRNRLQPVRAKRQGELRYWADRVAGEGTLRGDHYAWFYTSHFGLTESDYNERRVLDVGCGPRGSLEWAAGAGARIGLDPLASDYRGLGTARHAMAYVAATAHALPFPDGSFDFVTSFNSLDHVDDLPRTVGEIKRVLRPGGRFLLLAETNQPPTLVEPITLTWDTPSLFEPELEATQVRHFEMLPDGMYDSVRAGRAYDHDNVTGRSGILSAMFRKS
jgi:glycosyltransferase involved in cell wall biosynthesis/SAM-dependent methyltransferase